MDTWLFNPLRLGVKQAAELAKAAEAPPRLTVGRQLVFYMTVVFGNIASSFLEAYKVGQIWHPNITAILFAFVVGFVLLPGAVDQNKLNGQKEELVQYAMVFTYGMGGQTLVSAAIRVASGG
jgi:hypothetical protein